MKLYARPASPFARKVRVLIIETGLTDEIEIIMLKSIEEARERVPEHNPLGKVPALELDNGESVIDSRVISEYLDSLHSGASLFPAGGWERWHALRLQSMGDGIGDAAVLMGAEGMRPEAQRSSDAIARQWGKITKTTGLLEDHMDWLRGGLNIGQIAVATGLGYADFRLDDFEWRDGRPKLAAWIGEFNERASMKETFFERPG